MSKQLVGFLLVASVVFLAACGGGSSSGVRATPPTTPDPPMQSISISSLAQITDQRGNPSAEDFLDHWNDPEVLQGEIGTSGLNSSEISARISTLKSIVATPTDQVDESLTLLRNVDAETMIVIGERDGITYGQWKSGPAGTLDIDFDYRFAPALDESDRAQIERAGKSWSWRLGDEFATRSLSAGLQIDRSRIIGGVQVEELLLDEEVTTDGLRIFVDRHNGTRRSYGSWKDPTENFREPNNFEPYVGSIRMGGDNFDRVNSRGNFNLVSVIAHEIGHVLGIATLGGNRIAYYDALVDEQAGTFNGPNAVEANGGDPVPFQWLDANRRPVAPGTSGATIDLVHLGPCTSVMAYCRSDNNLYSPSELDFAFLEDIGYELLEAGTEQEPEIYGFGAWGRYSAWGAGVQRTISYEQEINGNRNNIVAHDNIRAGADAFGDVPSLDFADAHQGVTGSVSWSGSLLGVDLGHRMLPPVFGDAALRVDLSSLAGTARFDELTVVVDGTASTFRAPHIEYAIDVTGNTFADEEGRIAGGFFGPAHEEMAGVLNDRSQDVNLLAGFGGTR